MVCSAIVKRIIKLSAELREDSVLGDWASYVTALLFCGTALLFVIALVCYYEYMMYRMRMTAEDEIYELQREFHRIVREMVYDVLYNSMQAAYAEEARRMNYVENRSTSVVTDADENGASVSGPERTELDAVAEICSDEDTPGSNVRCEANPLEESNPPGRVRFSEREYVAQFINTLERTRRELHLAKNP